MVENKISSRHSSRQRPLELSIAKFCIGLPGAMFCHSTHDCWLHRRISIEVHSAPLSDTVAHGLRRFAMIALSRQGDHRHQLERAGMLRPAHPQADASCGCIEQDRWPCRRGDAIMKPATPKQPQRLRCVIYTRVSSDSGLEQEFNSLDNQREAGEAYVKSQAHEGWGLNSARYDDGGFSGGSLERPALKQ